MTKNLVLWLIIAAVLLTVFNNFSQEAAPNRVSYSEFVQAVQRALYSTIPDARLRCHV